MNGAVEPTTLFWTAVALVLLLLLVRGVRRWRQRRRKAGAVRFEWSIEVDALPAHGPPAEGPQLEFYHVPIRLAVVVVAPVGRDGSLPPHEARVELVGELLPSLGEIFARDRPALFGWPPQVSSQGFLQAFFGHVQLPGNEGKGTPWCSVAGKAELGGQIYLVGMVGCAERPNSLGQVLLERPSDWYDVLRVRLR